MRTLAVIPARYASTRLPGKPLLDIAGKPMIQRVYEQVKKSDSVTDIVVATDDERIVAAVKVFGGNVVMTNKDHLTGTDRLCEVADLKKDYDYYLNIQGDEPFVSPEIVDSLTGLLKRHEGKFVATLYESTTDSEKIVSSNTAKVAIGVGDRAIYFSRNPIPHSGNTAGRYLLHIGMYGFPKSIIDEIRILPQSELEKSESLEQLRWLSNGITIFAAEVSHKGLSIDTAEDLAEARKIAALNG